MKTKKSSLIFLGTALILTVLASCTIPFTSIDEITVDEAASRAVVGPLGFQSIVPSATSASVAISDSVIVSYNNKISLASLSVSSITVVRADTGEAIAGRISLDSTGTKVIFKPIFQTAPTGSSIKTSGLKPNVKYTVVVSNSIRDINGSSLSADLVTNFTTVNLDYGIYWFNASGESEKFVSGKTNSFYDPSKPVVIFVHGWEKDATANNYWREVPYIWNDKYVANMNTGAFWKNAGYNIGVFYWNQFADEGEVKDAEAKVWLGNNGKQQMRYRLSDNSYVSFSTTKSVTDLFYDEYVLALKGNTSGNIRLVGHSLGNQLATTLAWKVSNAVRSGSLVSSYLPNRLALLDAFWGKDAQVYTGGKWTGEVCRTYINDLISRHGMVVEQAKSSALGGALAGDENLDMRKKTCFFRIWPDFIGATDTAFQHGYAALWYFWSMSAPVSATNGALGAASSNATIKSMMNYGKSTVYYWVDTGACTKTATPLDDTFVRKSGVSTW